MEVCACANVFQGVVLIRKTTSVVTVTVHVVVVVVPLLPILSGGFFGSVSFGVHLGVLLLVLVLVLLLGSMDVSLVVPSRVVRRHPPPHHPMCRRHLSGHMMSPEETLVMMIMLTMTIWRSFVSIPRRRRLRLLLVTVRLWHSGNLTPCTQDTGNSCAAQRHSACRG